MPLSVRGYSYPGLLFEALFSNLMILVKKKLAVGSTLTSVKRKVQAGIGHSPSARHLASWAGLLPRNKEASGNTKAARPEGKPVVAKGRKILPN